MKKMKALLLVHPSAFRIHGFFSPSLTVGLLP